MYWIWSLGVFLNFQFQQAWFKPKMKVTQRVQKVFMTTRYQALLFLKLLRRIWSEGFDKEKWFSNQAERRKFKTHEINSWHCHRKNECALFLLFNHLTLKCQVDGKIFDFHMFGICNVKIATQNKKEKKKEEYFNWNV